MRYVDLPQSYYLCYSSGLANAMYYDNAIISHLEAIDSPEKPAMIADFLLRFELVQWSLMTAVYENRLVISLRTSNGKLSAADMIRRLLRGQGDGGGHRTKAGGFIPAGKHHPGGGRPKANPAAAAIAAGAGDQADAGETAGSEGIRNPAAKPNPSQLISCL